MKTDVPRIRSRRRRFSQVARIAANDARPSAHKVQCRQNWAQRRTRDKGVPRQSPRNRGVGRQFCYPVGKSATSKATLKLSSCLPSWLERRRHHELLAVRNVIARHRARLLVGVTERNGIVAPACTTAIVDMYMYPSARRQPQRATASHPLRWNFSARTHACSFGTTESQPQSVVCRAPQPSASPDSFIED
jgi:hypothetical protein